MMVVLVAEMMRRFPPSVAAFLVYYPCHIEDDVVCNAVDALGRSRDHHLQVVVASHWGSIGGGGVSLTLRVSRPMHNLWI